MKVAKPPVAISHMAESDLVKRELDAHNGGGVVDPLLSASCDRAVGEEPIKVSTEPAEAAVSGAPALPTLAAELVIVLTPDPHGFVRADPEERVAIFSWWVRRWPR